jgi:hypothetical protein
MARRAAAMPAAVLGFRLSTLNSQLSTTSAAVMSAASSAGPFAPLSTRNMVGQTFGPSFFAVIPITTVLPAAHPICLIFSGKKVMKKIKK